MFFLISPAKNLDESPWDMPSLPCTQAVFPEQAATLMAVLQGLAPQDLSVLMSVSDKIARLNVERNMQWRLPFDRHNAKPAVFLFNGDVYGGLDAPSLDETALHWLQAHSGILSGLYGLLRPLDLIRPYRLEMGTRLANPRGRDLYAFWHDLIGREVGRRVAESGSEVLVNLASQEYFKAVDVGATGARVLTPVFQDEKNGQYKVISFYAKRARGLMLRYAAERGIDDVEELKSFNTEGYIYSPQHSSENEWIFRRTAV